MREIVLDTETTGLDPQSGDRIVEIGCVEIYNHMPTGKFFHEESIDDIKEQIIQLKTRVMDYQKESHETNYTEKLKDLIDGYHPIHKINVPRVTRGIDEGAKGAMFAGSPDFVNLPSLGPKINAPAVHNKKYANLKPVPQNEKTLFASRTFSPERICG